MILLDGILIGITKVYIANIRTTSLRCKKIKSQVKD
jgi:hypothetical protein